MVGYSREQSSRPTIQAKASDRIGYFFSGLKKKVLGPEPSSSSSQREDNDRIQKAAVKVIWDHRILFMKHHLNVAPLLLQHKNVASAATIVTNG